MVLEAAILIVDNSAFALNGDYTPTRYGAQTDATQIMFNAKTGSNPESVVGLMTASGKRGPEVLVNLTQDQGKIQAALHDLRTNIEGEGVDIATAVQIAQLCLKHRANKNQRQRIVLFVGSPLDTDKAENSSASLTKLGKKLKKNNVALDVVSFGEIDENEQALNSLVQAVNSSDNSHLLTVPPTTDLLLSDAILSSAILIDPESGAAPGGSGSGGGAGNVGADGEIDPNLDPELAMALRMSMEDERARQAASNPTPEPSTSSEPTPSIPAETNQPTHSTPAPPTATMPSPLDSMTELGASSPMTGVSTSAGPEIEDVSIDQEDEEDEDEELARALAMSRGEDTEMDEAVAEDDEDEEIRRAIALSLQGGEEEKK